MFILKPTIWLLNITKLNIYSSAVFRIDLSLYRSIDL